ncbi:HlyD family secretion protein [Roseateles chitinivorans]|uniref:HlyD family secretion protein n=1 Tax=Roseateles chitinivorans TaxID=2917965 RepID=UPI003D66B97A
MPKMPRCLCPLALIPVALLGACGDPPPPAWSGYAEGDPVYVAAPVAGQLVELQVQRGDTVNAGVALFSIDGTPVSAARAEADARLAAAKAEQADVAKGRRPDEIAMSRAQLAQARAQSTLAEADLARQQQLIGQGFISASRLDDARAAAAQARQRVRELESSLRVAELPARNDQQAAARANTAAASAALAQQQWRESQTRQSAPAAGLVDDTFYRVGEYVNAGQPVVSLLPPAQRKARFYVPEPELASLRPGQNVQLSCDGCGAPIAARISYISPQPEYTPPVIYSNSQRSRLVFLVEARPDPAQALRLHPGQPLEVRPVAIASSAPRTPAPSITSSSGRP